MNIILRLLLCLSFLTPLRAEFELKTWIEDLEKTAAQMEEMAADDGTIEILSLYPSQLSKPPAGEGEKDAKEAPPKFHRYPILGRAKVTDAIARKELLTELAKSIRASIRKDGAVEAFLCFNPRHGIIYTKGDKKLELLICFECESVHSYDGKQERPVATFSVKSSIGPDVFNAFLDKNRVERNVPKQ
ncbi:hypothetical protein OKA05_21775 [Luteolibacter arcticus]|uniref:Uncharacterized protein n=1 Tax=Luteolibacter arcticus TaxID=1581411 RepID=A0ABT3GNV9_9BACT|nr:hypothetical protein [Luteolibacter arcticus]MCW1925204.1 hypothetical protein [Luteolibacter arcticus]